MSGIGVIGRKRTSRSYCAHLYCTMKHVYDWRYYFVIIQDLDAKNTVVREHYGHFARLEATLRVMFEGSEITLDIPEDGLVTREGWRITPCSYPTISRKEADQFEPGHWIPECQLLVQWEREDQKPVPLRHKVNLIGAKAPYNFILLTLNPAMEDSGVAGGKRMELQESEQGLDSKYAGLESEPKLSDLMNEVASKVPAKWKHISIQLGLTLIDLERIENDSIPNHPIQCFASVFQIWKSRETRPYQYTTRPYTWSTVIQALESPSVGEMRLAQELRTKLQSGSVTMSDKEAQAIVDQALESGSIKQRNTIAIIVGIVGSGKTWLIHRLFRISPPDRYTSTGLAEKSFRGLMHRIANMDSWEFLSQEDILEFLAPLLKAGLTKANIVSLAKTFTEKEVQQAAVSSSEDFTEVDTLQPTVSETSTEIDAPQAASPSHSHATVAQPQPEKNYASQAMTSLVQTVKGPQKIFVVEFLHMIDTGGQPEFIEIMPSLIHNSNFTMLVLNLAQSLDEYPPIDFHVDGRAFKRPLPSVLTNRQVIHQFARTLQAKRPTQTGSQPSMFTVIGTHKDCVTGKLSETLAAVNKELKNIFLPAMEDELIVYRSHDEIIFPVNLLEPDDNDKIVLEQIRQKISDAHLVEEAEIPLIPFSFFMFEQNAMKYAEQNKTKDRQVMVLSFDECVQIGTELKMSSEVVRAALIYFHRHNIFLYFQDVLPNLVFLAPQVPLDFVNAIVAFSYKVKCGAWPALKAKYVRFCNEGIITEEMLCDRRLQFSDCFIPGIYEPQHAIKLFRHIYTIAEEPLVKSQQPSTHSNRTEQKSSRREYLMMSLLTDRCKICIKEHLPSPSKVAPLVIHFSNCCVPNGCFGNVISCLISKYNWKVCRTEQGKPECLAHNIATLRSPKLSKATIVNYTQHLEIHVNMYKVKEQDFGEICSHIHSTVFTAIGKVFKVMRFEDIYVEPAFHCPCKCSQKSHVAKVCDISTGSSYLVCTKTGEMSQLQRQHKFWLHHGKEGSSPQNPDLKDLMDLKVSDWYRLGLALQLNSYDLDIIKKDHPGDTRSQTCYMFDRWLRTQPNTSYEQLIKALRKVGDERVINSLCKYAMYSLESLPKDSSTKCSPSSSAERPKDQSSSSRWKYSPSPKRHHIPRDWQSRSPEGEKHSSSRSSSKRRRTKSRSHKHRSKSSSPRRRSRSQSPPPRKRSRPQSPPGKRSRSCSPRHSSSSRHHSRSQSPKSRRRSHYQSTHRRSHYRFSTSRSRSHSQSPKNRKTRSRSQSPNKQKLKPHSPRRWRSQSPSRKRSKSRSPRHSSSSRYRSRSPSPKSRKRQSPSWSFWERYSSGSPTSRSTSHSHSPERSKSRSHSSRKHRSKSSSPKRRSRYQSPPRRRSMSRSPTRKKSRSHSPSNNSNSRHQSRSHSSKSHRRRSPSWSLWERYSSGSPTSRSASHSHSPERSKSRSHSSRKHRSKSSSPKRRTRYQSPPRRRSMSPSPQRRSMSPRKRSKSRSPRHSSSSTHQSRSQSHRERSQSPPRRRLRSHSPRHSNSSGHRSRSQSPKSHRRRPRFQSPHRRSRSRSRTSRNTSHSHRPKRRSKPRS